MKCPVDQTTLAIGERQGIEIDYCPTCRGIWLDRGELDKLIAKFEAEDTHTPAPAPRSSQPTAQPYREERYRDHDDDDHHHYNHGHRRKKSIFGELFDF